MNRSVLIADDMHQSIIPMLEEVGFTPDYQPFIQRDELLRIIGNYQGLIIRSKTKIDIEVLDKATQLEFIGRAGAGLDLIDVDAAHKRNIQVFAANEGNRDAVAEHVIGMILCLFNKINTADSEVRQRVWLREANRGIELKGMTVGIIGFGNMGQALSERLKGFGVQVLAYDKYKQGFGTNFVREVSLEELLEKADLLSFHVPLTSETRMWFDDAFLNQCKKSVFLVNSSRGEIASVETILKGLQSGKIRGACLDVLENEKMAKLTSQQEAIYDALFQQKNVILTPHVAGWTVESYKKINDVLLEKIKNQYA